MPTLRMNPNRLWRLKRQQLQVRVCYCVAYCNLLPLGSGELNVVGPLGQHLTMAGPGPTTAVMSTSRKKRARSKTMTTSTAADKLVAAIPPAEEFPVMSTDDWDVLRTNAAPDSVLKVFGLLAFHASNVISSEVHQLHWGLLTRCYEERYHSRRCERPDCSAMLVCWRC